MKRMSLFGSLAVLFLLAAPAEAHRSGCHRWHSCPSDSGSYVCGDLGYTTYCPTAEQPVRIVVPAAAPPTSGATRYTTTSLNLRSGPTAQSAKVSTLKGNTKVTLLGSCSGGWCRVRTGSVSGYVSQKYLR